MIVYEETKQAEKEKDVKPEKLVLSFKPASSLKSEITRIYLRSSRGL